MPGHCPAPFCPMSHCSPWQHSIKWLGLHLHIPHPQGTATASALLLWLDTLSPR